MKGKIHSVETFGTVDGPGIRYVVFLQGCNFRCLYCHNPDTWACSNFQEMTSQELVDDIVKYKRYIDGVTVSGGEPLLQIDFVIDLFEKVKQEGLTTCLDTNGSIFDKNNNQLIQKYKKLMSVTDLVMLDIKHIDSLEHEKLTGSSNKNTLEFAEFVDNLNKDLWLRYVLVPTINDNEKTLINWKNFANNLHNVKKIEVLPYHKLGLEKYKALGLEYKLKDIKEPTKEQIEQAKNILNLKEDI